MESVRIRNFDFNKLMDFAAGAKGSVFLQTDEKDTLNLHSRLTGLVMLSGALENGGIREATVVCANEEDASRLSQANLYKR